MPKLQVQLISAKTLLSADADGNSDPYCILKIGQTSFKSRVEKKTLNPTWKETFTFEVANPDTEQLLIEVYDHDDVSANDFLGSTQVPLNNLVQGQEKLLWVRLEGGELGENFMGMASNQISRTIHGFLRKKKGGASTAPTNDPAITNKGEVKIGLTAVDFGSSTGTKSVPTQHQPAAYNPPGYPAAQQGNPYGAAPGGYSQGYPAQPAQPAYPSQPQPGYPAYPSQPQPAYQGYPNPGGYPQPGYPSPAPGGFPPQPGYSPQAYQQPHYPQQGYPPPTYPQSGYPY